MPLWLSNEDAQNVLTMQICLDALEKGYRQLAQGRGVERRPSRTHTYLPTGQADRFYMFNSIEGGIQDPGVYAMRISSDNIRVRAVGETLRREKIPLLEGGAYLGLILLFDISDGRLLAIMQDGYINMMCTGAAGGLGSKHLARQDARKVGMIGSG